MNTALVVACVIVVVAFGLIFAAVIRGWPME